MREGEGLTASSRVSPPRGFGGPTTVIIVSRMHTRGKHSPKDRNLKGRCEPCRTIPVISIRRLSILLTKTPRVMLDRVRASSSSLNSRPTRTRYRRRPGLPRSHLLGACGGLVMRRDKVVSLGCVHAQPHLLQSLQSPPHLATADEGPKLKSRPCCE